MSITTCSASDQSHAVHGRAAAFGADMTTDENEINGYEVSREPARPPVQLLDRIPHMVWSATPEGRLIDYNATWSELVGARAGMPVESALLGKLHPSDRQRWSDNWRRALGTRQPYEIEYRLESPGAEHAGEWHWYLERGTSVNDRGDRRADCWVATATLVDDYKRRGEESRQELDRRDAFFAMVLHELRNPLTPISRAVELLGDSSNETQPVNIARGIIRRQLRQVTRLVDDLLDISRSSYGNVRLQYGSVDLADAITVAVEAARPMIEMRRHQLSILYPQGPVCLHADAVRLSQVLTNLLINAAKYTPPDGHITVTAAPEDGMVAIRVRDDGIGIAPEKLRDIFELFARVSPTPQAPSGGLGIGLAVARQLVEAHHGTISAFSEGLGRGAEFMIRLPKEHNQLENHTVTIDS